MPGLGKSVCGVRFCAYDENVCLDVEVDSHFLLHCCTHCCSQEIVSNGSGVASMQCIVAMACKQAGAFVRK